MSKVYSYIGVASLNGDGLLDTPRVLVTVAEDALTAAQRAQPSRKAVSTVFTYVVDAAGLLWIADRHSEHVACARGGDVLSAGEMTFDVEGASVLVADVTNQSTGYCPEPKSWPAVAAALEKAGIPHPPSFTRAFLFRLCEGCGQTNVVKEGDFTCAVCGTELRQEWNFSHDTRNQTKQR